MMNSFGGFYQDVGY